MSDEPTRPDQVDVPGERPYNEPTSASSPPEDLEHDGGKGGARYQPAEPDDVRESVSTDHGATHATAASADGGKKVEPKSEPADGKKAEPKSEPAGKDGAIQVKFDGTGWCVEDPSLDKPLKFEHLADAERRASELGKDKGRAVCVLGQEGEVIASYAAGSKPPKSSMS